MSRRELLTKGFKTAVAFGLGAVAFDALGDFNPLNPLSTKAMNNLTTADINFAAAEPCVLTCQKTLGTLPFGANRTVRFTF